jgi:hypothetical protein
LPNEILGTEKVALGDPLTDKIAVGDHRRRPKGARPKLPMRNISSSLLLREKQAPVAPSKVR